ncbi:type IV pilus modification protein PilV [Ectopseudomonas mendocina]|uniref:type IV pilus modification protein PilV n=1 Tax=Ectopseudomonas hydrolytica TaxID=2493633 RepID=UPI000BC2E4BD|nr:type IV pilus modification protein PilV [Pseudomonas mendocina]
MKRNSRGFSFIEVLVTLVLLTIGVLGMVAMQGRGIQLTNDSLARNNAAMLATELMEKMRANPGYLAEFTKMKELPDDGDCASPDPDDTAAPIKAEDVKRQLGCWSERVRTLLPGTDGDTAEAQAVRNEFRACRSKTPGACDNGSAVEVQVAWRSNGEACGNESTDARFICRFRLRGEL